MGKRMDGQLTITEFAVMVTLGAIVSVPMQIPERGILLGIIALICILVFQRGINWLAVKNQKVEEVTQGTLSVLIKNGVLQIEEMHRVGMSRQNLFAALRAKEIFNLGQVKRVYFEACGLINIYKDESNRPGLPILPDEETKFVRNKFQSERSKVACVNCGNVTASNARESQCENCNEKNWVEAAY
jgi:uncharacterized membrane protein YcaP (DUF421 family)